MDSKNNLIHKIIKKYRNQSGETITKVLVASLVIAFGSILLATMVTASTKIIQKSMVAYDQYMDLHNGAESLTDTGLPSGLKIEKSDGTKVVLEAYKNTPDAILSNEADQPGIYGRKLNTGSGSEAKTYISEGPFQVSLNESVNVYTVPGSEASSRYSFSKYFSSDS